MNNTLTLNDVLASAARLQQLLPDAVLVGGSAAAAYAGHRLSFDHDHVLSDLSQRFDVVLDALEREGDWVTNRVSYGKLILGELGGIETGVRQLIRRRPLELEQRELPNGAALRLPTLAECLRIKAFLIVKRNQTRDYLDVAALADLAGLTPSAIVLANIDDYYADQAPDEGTVAAQVANQLADPQPKDLTTTTELHKYKGLVPRWHTWTAVVAVCKALALAMSETATAVPQNP
ncbi:MAG: hypothetical protein LBC29_03675 [Propionibacteriaceae bacterium]|jgi:hypothetical protein|nr:hypothetical protein [Propionibacteriaceae bacterium]